VRYIKNPEKTLQPALKYIEDIPLDSFCNLCADYYRIYLLPTTCQSEKGLLFLKKYLNIKLQMEFQKPIQLLSLLTFLIISPPFYFFSLYSK
jgi:hypothetical protein